MHCRPAAPRVWALLSGLERSPAVAGNVLARLLATKLCQRLAMVPLQQRLAPWRYTKASVQLAQPAAAAAGAAAGAAPAAGLSSAVQEEEVEAEAEEYDIAEEVEEVIAVLLSGLQDRDTVVPWSAAKGVGRVHWLPAASGAGRGCGGLRDGAVQAHMWGVGWWRSLVGPAMQ